MPEGNRVYDSPRGLLKKFRDWFVRAFARNPEEARHRAEIRRLQGFLAELDPPYYRAKQSLVLPSFAHSVLHFYALIKPFAELARSTIANSDIRISQRYFDYLIDCHMPTDEQERKRFFFYGGISERTQAAPRPNDEMESILREFQAFLVSLDALGSQSINADLHEVERFIDLCGHDYERIVGLFDPSANIDDPRYQPDFAPVPGEQILPELVDFYYLTESLAFTPRLKENVLHLLEKRQPGGLDEVKKGKIDRLFYLIERYLAERLSTELLLVMIRVIKDDPAYKPSTPRDRRDFLEAYRRRLITQFEKDRERIQREQHEKAIAADIRLLFGDEELLELNGYDEKNDTFLRRESPNGFIWIKPLRILKTFIVSVFEPQLQEAIKRILVEGYFDNKGFQNNLANILYQCERSGGRLHEFEEQLGGNGRHSLVAMMRYIEELKRGKDITTYLSRLVDAINDKAYKIVEDEAGLFAMLGEALGELLADFKRSSPDLVANIRTLGGGRNREFFAQIQGGRERILILVKIMRNFSFVKSSSADQAGPDPATAIESESSIPSRVLEEAKEP